jgi:hypothetical protein
MSEKVHGADFFPKRLENCEKSACGKLFKFAGGRFFDVHVTSNLIFSVGFSDAAPSPLTGYRRCLAPRSRGFGPDNREMTDTAPGSPGSRGFIEKFFNRRAARRAGWFAGGETAG